MLQSYHEASQELHSVLSPHTNQQDVRHPDKKVMTYTKSTSDPPEDLEYIRDGVEDVGEILKIVGLDRGNLLNQFGLRIMIFGGLVPKL